MSGGGGLWGAGLARFVGARAGEGCSEDSNDGVVRSRCGAMCRGSSRLRWGGGAMAPSAPGECLRGCGSLQHCVPHGAERRNLRACVRCRRCAGGAPTSGGGPARARRTRRRRRTARRAAARPAPGPPAAAPRRSRCGPLPINLAAPTCTSGRWRSCASLALARPTPGPRRPCHSASDSARLPPPCTPCLHRACAAAGGPSPAILWQVPGAAQAPGQPGAPPRMRVRA